MPGRPKLSLCIPTWNRGKFLEGALLSGLKEAASQPLGCVEVLVSDNYSDDNTQEITANVKSIYPELRILRNAENLGFDLNYLTCIKEARGEFVWVMGDDDIWLPGSVAAVLRELKAGADACLFLAQSCDLELNPLYTLPFYQDPTPPRVMRLDSRDSLIAYFNSCCRNAGVFSCISMSVFNRDRFLLNQDSIKDGVAVGYTHLLGMMKFLRKPTKLHYISRPLIRNRFFNHGETYGYHGESYLFGRWMWDLRAWDTVATEVFSDDPELADAFYRVVGRNHHNTILPGLRQNAPDEPAWEAAKPYLIRAGFSPIRIAAMEFAFNHVRNDRHPFASLNPGSLCLADLAILARGSRRVAVLALTLQSLLEGAGILAAFKQEGRPERLRIFCASECLGLLSGFQTQTVDLKRYSVDLSYRESVAQIIIEFGPELAVNLDRNRGIESDYLVACALPAGAIAFEHPDLSLPIETLSAANEPYTCLVSRLVPLEEAIGTMIEALGMSIVRPELWPDQTTLQQAISMFAQLGWEPSQSLVVFLDHPSVLEQSNFKQTFNLALESGHSLIGMGGNQTHPLLEQLLAPLGDKGLNLAGKLGLGPMAAILKLSGWCFGGTPLMQALAKACGCKIFPQT